MRTSTVKRPLRGWSPLEDFREMVWLSGEATAVSMVRVMSVLPLATSVPSLAVLMLHATLVYVLYWP